MPLADYLFAARVGLWLCAASWSLRRRALPDAVRRMAAKPAGRPNRIPLDRAVYIIARVCGLRVFRLSFFPRVCLRRSMALFHFLGGMGYPVQLHVGVHKDRAAFEGHSWVSLAGERIADAAPDDHFQVLFHYPPADGVTRHGQPCDVPASGTGNGDHHHEDQEAGDRPIAGSQWHVA